MKHMLILTCICLLFLLSCAKQYYVADINFKSYRIEKASYAVDVKVASIIEPYKLQLDRTMNEIIGECEVEMIKKRPGSDLTNWFGDVLLDETQKLVVDTIDFAIQNYGGIRIPALAKGPVTVGKIFELMPFDNIMFIQQLKGNTVQQLFDAIAEKGGWPVSRNVRFDIVYGKAKNIRINDIPLDTSAIYTAAIPDYIANGGDNMLFLKEQKTYNTGALIRDLLISHVRTITASGQKIKSTSEQRIKE